MGFCCYFAALSSSHDSLRDQKLVTSSSEEVLEIGSFPSLPCIPSPEGRCWVAPTFLSLLSRKPVGKDPSEPSRVDMHRVCMSLCFVVLEKVSLHDQPVRLIKPYVLQQAV